MPRVLFKNKLDSPALGFSTGNRPTQAQFVQLNTASIQNNGLVACWPMWEPASTPIVDICSLGLVGAMYLNWPTIASDAMFGNHPVGGGDGNGGGTMQGYRIPHNDVTDMGVNQVAGVPWASSFWFRTLITTNGPQDSYLQSYCNTTAPFSGTAIGLETGNDLAHNTNGTTLTDAAFKTDDATLFNLGWHHILFVQVPQTPNTYNSTNVYYIDGALDRSDSGCCAVGLTTSDLWFLSNNQGDPPADGAICEYRMYRSGANLVNPTTRLALAQSLFNTATRWELYLGNGLT